MELKEDAWMPFPRALVYRTYRDTLPDLVKYLPNIRGIEVRERSDDGPVARLLNVWHGGGEIPAAARAFLSESLLSWDDHATWVESEWYVDWKIVPHAFSEAVSCGGRNRFLEERGGTRLEIRGTFAVDGKKIRGIPGFLSGKVGRAVEEVLVGKIQPNLVAVSEGVRRHLEAQAAAGKA